MKNSLTILAIIFSLFCNAQQGWQAVGPDDFEQISLPHAAYAKMFTDTLGNVFVVFRDSSVNYNYSRIRIKRETTNGWVNVTSVENVITNDPSFYSIEMDKAGNFYYASDTVIGNTNAIVVKKFDGNSWSFVGTPYLLSSSTYPKIIMRIDPHGNPYILYASGVSSIYPAMIKWDGTNWVSVGGTIVNTSSGSIDFDVDRNNTPYVIYNDAMNGNSPQVKKFDGVNWVIVGSLGASAFITCNIKIHDDTVYVVITNQVTVQWSTMNTFGIQKFNGTNWVSVVSSSMSSQAGTPYTSMLFDTMGTIYLGGNFMCKITNASVSYLGESGSIALKGHDTLYVTNTKYGGKVSVKKRINNNWVEDYPLSIEPYYGVNSGYNYNNGISTYPHYLFADKTNTLNLFSLYNMNNSNFGGAVLKYSNNNWLTNVLTNQMAVKEPYRVVLDTADDFHIMFCNLYSSSMSSSGTRRLYKLSGASWSVVGSNQMPITYDANYGSAVFDKNNTPYVVFSDISSFGSNRIRVKKYDGSNWIDPSTVMQFVSTNASVNPLIVSDTANNISVLYKEASTQNLILKKFDGISWNAVGSPIGTASNTDFQIALTETGEPVVVYLDIFNNLKKPVVKKYDGTNWVTLGTPGFSYGEVMTPRLLVDKDTVYVTYADKTLKNIVVAKYNGNYFGALGSPTISRDSASYPILVKAGNDIYVSYYSYGIFVKKNINNILVPLLSCQTPTITITANNIDDTSAILSWSNSQQVLGYEYHLTTNNTPPTTNGTFTNLLTFPATALLPNTTYYFFVRTICGIDTSAWAMTSFTTTNTTNINELFTQNTGLTIYPNPVTSVLQIEQLNTTKKIELELYDVQRRKLKAINFSSKAIQVDVKDLSEGIYFIKNKGGNLKTAFKVIKQ